MNIVPVLRAWTSAGNYTAREIGEDLLAFRFGDEANLFPVSTGGVALLRLLANSGRDLPAWELERHACSRVATRTIPLESPEALKKAEKRMEEIALEYLAAEEKGDREKMATLQEERRGLLKFLRGNSKLPGGGRRSAASISAGLRRFYEEIRSTMPTFADHLPPSIWRRECGFVYVGKVPWKVTLYVTPKCGQRKPMGVEEDDDDSAGVEDDESSGQTVD